MIHDLPTASRRPTRLDNEEQTTETRLQRHVYSLREHPAGTYGLLWYYADEHKFMDLS